MISIDGRRWSVPCDMTRTAEVRPSEISGMMLDKSYFNDVIGTYLQYDVTLAVPPSMTDEYDAIYEALTDPVDGHQFILPYGQSTVQLTARVEDVKDVYVRTLSGKGLWRGIQFSVTANHPTKKMELGEVVTLGRTQLPESIDVPVGTVYEATASGWVEIDLIDADSVWY